MIKDYKNIKQFLHFIYKMGKSNSKGEKAIEYADEIIENINSFYKGMKVRQMNILDMEDQILSILSSDESIDKEIITNFLKDKIYNEEFKKTSIDLVNQAIQDAQNNYNLSYTKYKVSGNSVKQKKVKDLIDYQGIMLPIFTILILSNSDQNAFIGIFKNIYDKKKQRNIHKDNKMGYFAKGVGLLLEDNKSKSIEKKELEQFLIYYLNFLTLLPMNSLVSNNEGIPMKSQHIQIMNAISEQKYLKKFIFSKFLKDYGEKIKIEDFFIKNYLTLKNDNELRKSFIVGCVKIINKKK